MDDDRCSLCIIMSLCDTKELVFNRKVVLLWMITHSFSHMIVNFRGWTITHIFLASVGFAQARPNRVLAPPWQRKRSAIFMNTLP